MSLAVWLSLTACTTDNTYIVAAPDAAGEQSDAHGDGPVRSHDGGDRDGASDGSVDGRPSEASTDGGVDAPRDVFTGGPGQLGRAGGIAGLQSSPGCGGGNGGLGGTGGGVGGGAGGHSIAIAYTGSQPTTLNGTMTAFAAVCPAHPPAQQARPAIWGSLQAP